MFSRAYKWKCVFSFPFRSSLYLNNYKIYSYITYSYILVRIEQCCVWLIWCRQLYGADVWVQWQTNREEKAHNASKYIWSWNSPTKSCNRINGCCRGATVRDGQASQNRLNFSQKAKSDDRKPSHAFIHLLFHYRELFHSITMVKEVAATGFWLGDGCGMLS